ncbi:MAG: hypothetical protein ACK5H1_01915 [Tenacibaculum sp.]
MYTFTKKISIVAMWFASGILLAQSPWTEKKNEMYFQLSFSTIAGYSELFGNPSYDTERQITDNTLQLYGIYGLSNKTSLFANIPLKMVSSGKLTTLSNTGSVLTNQESKVAFGNIQLGIKHNFYNNKWLLTAELGIEANTGSFYKESGLRTGYDAWTFTPLISAGRSFNTWYIQAFTGFDVRTNNYSSAFKLGGELGYKALDWLWVAGFLDGLASLKNGETTQSISNVLTGLYVNDQSYAAFGFKLIGQINNKLGINAAAGGAFAGRNVAKMAAFNLGLYYKP